MMRIIPCIIFVLFLLSQAMAATSTLPVDANGNVGVGTTTPVARLHVGGAGVPNAMSITGSDLYVKGNLEVDGRLYGDGSGITGVSAQPWASGAGAIYYNSGNVGIGTSVSGNVIDVFNLIKFNSVDNNTQIGYSAGANLVSGAQNNTFLGQRAGWFSTSGVSNAADDNTVIGSRSLFYNRTGAQNTVVGSSSIGVGTTGVQNSVLGNVSFNNTTGSGNTVAGYVALQNNTTGDNNTAAGFTVMRQNTTGYQNVAVGYRALFQNIEGNNNLAMGSLALYSNQAGSGATAVGYSAMYYANSTATPFTNYNVAVGFYALRGSSTASNNTGNYNTAIGYDALYNNTSGSYNTASGRSALQNNNTGSNNTASGLQAMQNNTTGSANVAVGGYNVLYNNSTGSNNVALGPSTARYQADGSTSLTDPENSVYLGYNAKGLDNNDDNAIVIGFNAISIGANKVVLGNDSITTTKLGGNIGIGTTVPQQKFEVRGGAILGSEYAVTTAASMTVNWANANQQYITLNQTGHTINFSNYKAGQALRLFICQDATGSRTVTAWDSSIAWAGGAAPTLTTAANTCDILSFVSTNAKGSVKNLAVVALNF